jgi:putative endonuclease
MAKGKVGLGRRGEQLVARALAQRGYTVIQRNWRCGCGEVDLILRRDREWYFVEVRTRRGAVRAVPEESLNPTKIHRMERVARTYLGLHVSALDPLWHLSFAAVAMGPTGKLERITFYGDLFAPPVTLFRADSQTSSHPTG